MPLDLRKASALLRKHIAERVRDYPLYVNEGPGKDDAPIKQITMGYDFDGAGWVAIVFDTRPKAEIDGEWNAYIEANAIEFPDWQQAYDELVEKGIAIKVTLPDGAKTTIGKKASEEEVAEVLGKALRDVLVSARDDGQFSSLPLAKNCALVVEEHDGYYGWSDQESEEPDGPEACFAALAGNVASKPSEGQIAHWINVLERMAAGKEAPSEWLILVQNEIFDRLKKLGEPAVVPLLKFVRKWASKPEYDGDRPQRNFNELPMQDPTIKALRLVHDSRHATPEVESLLRDILRRSIPVNTRRKLWGIIPAWSARCLARLFKKKYPMPKLHDSTNELLNRDDYAGATRS